MTIQALVGSLLLGLLCGCNAVDAMKDGMAQSNAVADDLQKSLGSKPHVEFDGAPEGKTLAEINDAARVAVKKEFPQMPKKIVLAFDVDAS